MAEARRIIRVADSSGNPIADALIAVEASDVPFPEISLISDSDGCVGLSFPAGIYRIAARTVDNQYGVIEVEIGENDVSSELIIVVQTTDTETVDE